MLSNQAKNSIELYRGNDPAKIEMLLKIQHSSVVQELMEHFHAKDMKELAVKLSLA